MDHLEFYRPFVEAAAARFSVGWEVKEDLVQEAFIQIEEIRNKIPLGESIFSENWIKRVRVAVRNVMIDVLRKQNTITTRDAEYGEDFYSYHFPSFKSTYRLDEASFARVFAAKSLEELKLLLSEIEMRILTEIVAPSDAFIWFVRRAKVVRDCFARCYSRYSVPRLADEGSLLRQFLGLSSSQYSRALKNIERHIH